MNINGLYVPGLGDTKPRGEDKIGGLWQRLYGISLDYHPVYWSKGNDFRDKLDILSAHIAELYEKSGRVALVGSSAGASAIINAYAANPEKVGAVVFYCGKIQNPQTISEDRFRANPAFKESLMLLPGSIEQLSDDELNRILSVRPIVDTVVPPNDTFIEGANHHLIPTFGHAASIALGLTIFSRSGASFIKENI